MTFHKAINEDFSHDRSHLALAEKERVRVPYNKELSVEYDESEGIVWQYMRPAGRPSFTLGLLKDMKRTQLWLRQLAADRRDNTPPVNYVVLASSMPGIFNLGGDLPNFIDLIRDGNRDELTRYAHACIDVQHMRAGDLNLPLVSISLVQGDALGGGFECALADDIIIAERGTKFGLPEVLFNLFPGMGAYSFLSRRLDPVRAEKMILSGRIYDAEELYEMGLVEELAEPGYGKEAVHAFIERNRRAHAMRRALYEVRRTVRPVSREELVRITNLWVDTAMNLPSADLRKMQRLAAAQDRRLATLPASGESVMKNV